jgi:hypothetical protein
MGRTSAGATVRNPLGLMSIFVALCEVIAGLAATQATGWVQGAFAVFAVVFPIGVIVVFITILWKRPELWYSPADFSRDTPVQAFVDAMNSRRNRERAAIDESLRVAVQEEVTRLAPSAGGDERVADRIVTATKRELANRSVTIEIDRITEDPTTPPLEFVVDDGTTVSDLLDFVYFGIAVFVRQFTYGQSWILRDRRTGQTYDEIGTRYIRTRGRNRDRRRLTEVGIKPGADLIAERL